MKAGDRLADDLAAAILDGIPIDWAAADSNAEEARPLVRQLKVLAAVADLHRGAPRTESSPPERPMSLAKHESGEPEQWGHLRLFELVGRGAFGEVYRAWDMRLDREVALKLLPAGHGPADRTSSPVTHEGRLLARVRHPNVVTIHGAEQIDGRVGLWMEFVRGHTLEQLLQERTVFSPAEVVDVGVELCRAIAAVHAAGLLHRDIKAHNVMRAADGRIVLMDFGTGTERQDDASADLAGTPLYLAPEVLQGRPATVRSDIYSVGVLLYHLITGSYPVQARTVREVRRAHERGQRIAVQTARRDVPSKLARMIERAIDPQPEGRYQSADVLGADLTALKPRPRVVRLAYAAGVAAAFILVAGLGWEIAGRQLGSSRTPGALLSRSAGLSSGGTVNVSPAERPVIAVLPLKNLSAEPDSDYFVDGLTDEIIRNLALIKGLQVRSPSSFALKDKPRNIPEVGGRLGANLVVEGSVLRSGAGLRINVQLIQVAGDVPLWTGRFDRELKDVFAIQDEISRAIVDTLQLTLGKDRRRYGTNLDAYDLYLRGRALLGRRGLANAQKAAEFFKRAIARDDGFAPAHAGLANAYAFWSFPFRGIPFETAYPIMRPAAVKALQLDPRLAEAHAAMGWVYSYERDWVNAEKAFQQAISLNPTLTQTYTSYSISTLQTLQKYDEALRLLQVASRHDPLSLDVQREIGQVQLFSGRYAEAIDTFERVSEIEPDFPFVQPYLARALMWAGRVEEGLRLLEPGDVSLAYAYVMTGRRAEAEKLAAEWERYPFRLAIIAAALGNTDRAIEAVERTAVSEPHRVGRLLIHSELAPFRDHPRVAALRKKFGLP